MLANQALFNYVENKLRESGIIDDFESKNGKIRGRMMITQCKIPEELGIDIADDIWGFAFQATFDFYDCAVGLALNLDTMEPLCGIWITPQAEDADEPSREWINFFIKTLICNIQEDGSFGLPMYTFTTDYSDFTVVPVAED